MFVNELRNINPSDTFLKFFPLLVNNSIIASIIPEYFFCGYHMCSYILFFIKIEVIYGKIGQHGLSFGLSYFLQQKVGVTN
jgi:hypothetical protein